MRSSICCCEIPSLNFARSMCFTSPISPPLSLSLLTNYEILPNEYTKMDDSSGLHVYIIRVYVVVD
ncbi:hypothetical protein Hanom_Chr16g01489831 [Helianthus anomalus]